MNKLCKCGCNQPVLDPSKTYIRYHAIRDPAIKEKRRQQFKDKYGVDNPSQLKNIKEKKKKTFQSKYGADCYFTSDEGKENLKQFLQDTYGVDNFFKTEQSKAIVKERWKNNTNQIREKIRDTNLDTSYDKIIHGNRLMSLFTPLFIREEYTGVGKDQYKFQCNKCKSICYHNLDDGLLPRCYTCYPLISEKGTSNIEGELQAFLQKLTNNLRFRVRNIIYPFELDVVFPEKKIAIELDGLYWHSENNGKDKNYHLFKTQACNKQGIKLIHIFEDEWIYKRKIVESRLKHILGFVKYTIYARNCIIKEIDKSTKERFIEKYHIQGNDKCEVAYGAYYGRHLVAVMTFCKLRQALGHKAKAGHFELSRFCTISNFNIVGIASKLLTHFERTYKPTIILTYADVRWSIGNLYNHLGFTLKHMSKPGYWYTKTYNQRIHRFNFQKHLLKEKLSVFDDTLTEWENMKRNGYDRIWDCGNYVFIKENRAESINI